MKCNNAGEAMSDKYVLAKWEKEAGYMSVFCGGTWARRMSTIHSPRYFTLTEVQEAIKSMSSFFTEEILVAIPDWALPLDSKEEEVRGIAAWAKCLADQPLAYRKL